MISRCCCCKKIKWIFKNRYDTTYNQKACWKCYCNSVKVAKKTLEKIREENEINGKRHSF